MAARERDEAAGERPATLSLFEGVRADGADDGDGDEGAADGAPPSGDGEDRRRRRTRRVLVWTLVALLGLLFGGAGAAYWTVDHYASSVDRIPGAFPTLPVDRQRRPCRTPAPPSCWSAWTPAPTWPPPARRRRRPPGRPARSAATP
ncbi:hypothetical protein ACFQ1I_18520 [Kitasatospora arboriphila]